MLALSIGIEASRSILLPGLSPVLPRGYVSCAFTTQELSMALRKDDGGCWDAAALSRGAGAAAAAVRAPLADDVASRGAELMTGAGAGAEAGAGAGGLRLRLLTDVAQHERPPLWFDEAALAALNMPFLTLENIRGGRSYECHLCGEQFERPNPLKLHLFLSCAPFDAAAFWALALRRLAAAEVRATVKADASPLADASTLADEAYARLEAAAAEWGRARGGHACVYCGKLYSRKYGLKIHIRTHTGYKPLRCRYCLRAFGDPSNLNKHVRLHAAPSLPSARGPTPCPGLHTCALCGKRLVRRRDLERHVRSRHGLCAP